MQDLIDSINKVHKSLSNAGLSHDLELPQIVVVGSQSVGKSSVLESIVGKDFLPRGKETVTRCPIHIALHPCLSKDEEYGIFDHSKEVMTDFSLIKQTITDLTKELCNQNQIVSRKSIYLRLYLHDVPSLTLIDLPGLIEISKDGQPERLKHEIEDIVNTHVKNPKAIILAVSSANNDVNNSCALRKAHEFDKKRERTVGVFTKCDLSSDLESLVKMLRNEDYQLKHGHFAVVCRSYEDEKTATTILKSREKESMHFEGGATFAGVQQQCSIPVLTAFLSTLLQKHVRQEIPALIERLEEKLRKLLLKKKKLNIIDKNKERPPRTQFYHLTRTFLEKMAADLEGQLNGASDASSLHLGGRLFYSLHTRFEKELNALPFKQPSYAVLKNNLVNCGGLCPSILPSDKLLIPFLKERIATLEQPALDFVGKIIDEVRRGLEKIVDGIPDLKNTPQLVMLLKTIIAEVVNSIRESPLQDVANIVRAEAAYIDMNCREMEATRDFALHQKKGTSKLSISEKYLVAQKNKCHTNDIQTNDIYNSTCAFIETQNNSAKLSENVKTAIYAYLCGKYDKPFTIDKLFVEFREAFSELTRNILANCSYIENNFFKDEEDDNAEDEEDDNAEDEEDDNAEEKEDDNAQDKENTMYTEEEQKLFFILHAIHSSYFSISKSNILNLSPKYFMLNFLLPLQTKLHERLSSINEEDIEKYMTPSSAYVKEKQLILSSEAALRSSLQCLQSEIYASL